VENRRRILAELEQRSAAPGFWDDAARARALIEDANRQKIVLTPFGELEQRVEDASLMIELAAAAQGADQAREALAETEAALKAAERAFESLELQALLSGPLDAHNAYLTLHAGAGGTESCDWAGMLLRMYRHYCEDHGFQVEVLDYQPGEEAGIRRVSFAVDGPSAYGYMKAERGVHRLVRISPFDANKRRHTTFAALDVVAEIEDDVEVEIRDEDLRTDTYRASGAGGQHVNKTDSAVRITHIPTGIVVAMQEERSQIQNRIRAMSLLKSRLLQAEIEKRDRELASQRKSLVGSGDRSEKIRTYNFPQNRCTDHRIGLTLYRLGEVMDGSLDMVIEPLINWQNAELLKNSVG